MILWITAPSIKLTLWFLKLKFIAETEQQRVQTAIINATTTYQNINQQLEHVNYTLSGITQSNILPKNRDYDLKIHFVY
jgi:hypothetical protein